MWEPSRLTPYRRRVLEKMAAEGPLTLAEAAITKNIMPTLVARGLAQPVKVDGGFRFEVTDKGLAALKGEGQ